MGTGGNRLEQKFCGWKMLEISIASCWKIWPWFEYHLSVEVYSLWDKTKTEIFSSDLAFKQKLATGFDQ